MDRNLDDTRNTFQQVLRRAQAGLVALAEKEPTNQEEPVSFQVPETGWPAMDAAALHGLVGDAVRLIEPHTEADSVSLVVSFLSEFGAMLNRAPHLVLDGMIHPLLFWPVLVGNSSKSAREQPGSVFRRS